MEPIIRVENLSKRYRLEQRQAYYTLRESLMRKLRRPFRYGCRPDNGAPTLSALEDVSFKVEAGEVLGVIGRNGAGKSTLLKILSRITEPSGGRVDLYGRVGSLLEVGTGFHPELTGRDNIFLSGAILGMRRAEIARKFDEIVAFAEIEKFVDTPVKRYSSGMYVRLAFAVAAHLEPEILLVDEVLAVGDAAFQKRCLGKMGDVAREGRTIIFVSHNMAAIESLCETSILFKEGRLEAHGPSNAIVERYLTSGRELDSGVSSLTTHPGRVYGSIPAMKRVTLLSDNRLAGAIRIGAPLQIRVDYETGRPIRPCLGIAMKTMQGAPVFAVSERFSHQLAECSPVDRGSINCELAALSLIPGTDIIDLFFGDAGGDFDRIIDAISFEVLTSDALGSGQLPPPIFGPMLCASNWTVTADD
jgi:lipopolysaccharide transport system ATP-binding protein